MNHKSGSSYESIDISEFHDENQDGCNTEINENRNGHVLDQNKAQNLEFSKMWPVTASLAGVFFGIANIFLGKTSEYGAYSREVT